MLREHELVSSEAMGRRMHLWRYGHFGAPVLVFPSASGMAHEWEAHKMVEALGDLIDGGRIKLYCVESNVSEAWTRKDLDPAWRIRRHQAFESYIVSDLVPLIRRDCATPDIPIAATGTSLGAFYSVNFSLKYPRLFNFALGLSGRYDATQFTGGFSNTDIYYNNPLAYVPNMQGEHLQQVRDRVRLTLVCGQGAWEDGNIQDTTALARMLDEKQITHECDLWGLDVAHEWTWWRRQARFHFGRAFG